MDSVKSTTFIKRPPFMTDVQENFIYTKRLLKGRIFSGYYKERRYVSELNEYRDVIFISPEETELLCDLGKLAKRWVGVNNVKWVGITGPESFFMPIYCFWCKLSELAFGCYWFQIKNVKLMNDEVILQLKTIRKSQVPFMAITSQTNQTTVSEKKIKKGKSSTSMSFNTKKTIMCIQESFLIKINSARSFLTWKNIVFTLKFLLAVVISLTMGIISLLGHLGLYSLKLIREVTLLVNAFTPIVIQLIDFLTKVVGGLYILLAGMFMRNYNPKIFRGPNMYRTSYGNIYQPPESLSVNWKERNRILRQELLSST